MFELIKSLLSGHNQFASGGLMLMVIGALGVYLRGLRHRVWKWLVSQTTMEITVEDDDAAFVWIKEWFLEQEFLKRVRRLDLDTSVRKGTLALVPAPGRHWFWFMGRPFVVYFSRSETTTGWNPRKIESFYLTTVGRSQKFLKRFVDEVVECHKRNSRKRSSLFVYDDCWERVDGYVPRLLGSVILRPGEKEHLVQDVEKFRGSWRRYRQLGVPYHRGYLLHGPPGTGKTSLVSALADRFGMGVYLVNLNLFNDRSLAIAINDVPSNSVILFEDIDCMHGSKARQDKEDPPSNGGGKPPESRDDALDRLGVTLSGLLNVLDGFTSPENVLFVMTTNRMEALDKALLRPGRIDYRLYMGEATEGQRVELYRRFFPLASEAEARACVEANPSAGTMAEFQGLLLALEQNSADWDQPAMPCLDEKVGNQP